MIDLDTLEHEVNKVVAVGLFLEEIDNNHERLKRMQKVSSFILDIYNVHGEEIDARTAYKFLYNASI